MGGTVGEAGSARRAPCDGLQQGGTKPRKQGIDGGGTGRGQLCRRCCASSTKPAPEAAPVTYLGGAASRPSNRRTLATPTELRKKANIGASFCESPTNTNPRFDRSRARPKRSPNRMRLREWFARTPYQPV